MRFDSEILLTLLGKRNSLSPAVAKLTECRSGNAHCCFLRQAQHQHLKEATRYKPEPNCEETAVRKRLEERGFIYSCPNEIYSVDT